MHEHREWPRYSAVRTFALTAHLGERIYPCVVADVSLGGARLLFDRDVPLDGIQDSGISLSHPEAETVVCLPMWREAGQVGVQFDFSEESLGLISVCIRKMVHLDQAP